MTSSDGKSSRGNKFLKLSLLVLFLCFIAGIYAVSGLPRPWASATPALYETVSFQRFTSLAKIIHNLDEDATTDQIKDVLSSEAGVSFDGSVGIYEGERLRILEQISPSGTIAIGLRRDDYGMVWAISRNGRVMKVIPE